MKRDRYAIEVGHRLRVTAAELGYPTILAFASASGASRPAVESWFNGRALIPVKHARFLCARGVTLDWIYRGEGSALSTALYIRLTGAMTAAAAAEVPPYVAPEPEGGARKVSVGQRKPRRKAGKMMQATAA